MTGAGLRDATVNSNEFGQFFVDFVLTDEASTVFAEHTRENQGKFLTIVLDKEVVSSPVISAVIEGSGQISGNFTLDEAQRLALAVEVRQPAGPVAH